MSSKKLPSTYILFLRASLLCTGRALKSWAAREKERTYVVVVHNRWKLGYKAGITREEEKKKRNDAALGAPMLRLPRSICVGMCMIESVTCMGLYMQSRSKRFFYVNLCGCNRTACMLIPCLHASCLFKFRQLIWAGSWNWQEGRQAGWLAAKPITNNKRKIGMRYVVVVVLCSTSPVLSRTSTPLLTLGKEGGNWIIQLVV